MTQYSERHIRLIKKEQELEKLFEEAANRRRKWLERKNEADFHLIDQTGKRDNYILKPLKSSENLLASDFNEKKVEISPLNMCRKLQRHSSYYSQHDLPETNLDYDEMFSHPLSQNTTNSSENLNLSGHRNPHFVTYSSSSDEIGNESNYCQFIPTTSLSTTNNTSSSHYSRTTDISTGKLLSLEPNSSDGGSHFTKDIDDNTRSVRDIEDNKPSVWDNNHSATDNDGNLQSDGDTQKMATVIFYPSGSPLISHKYQGSPVVRIDDKLRAGEADYLVNRRKTNLLKKPPFLPRITNLPHSLASPETRLSHPVLLDINDPSSPTSVDSPSNNSTSIIRRTKKTLLEEQMRKRFSVGDYSTRALIEWQNNLNCTAFEQMSTSGDLQSPKLESNKLIKRTLSTQSDALFPIYRNETSIATSHNFSSEGNIIHYSSTESIRDTQVSFSLKNDKQIEDKSQSRHSDKTFFKRSNFIRRSMNDLAAALKHVTSTEKAPSSKKFLFSNRGYFLGHGIFKKRDSTSSDLLYSVPPFARQHMPPDISGAARILTQSMYQNNNLPSSSPNLIAELDPTFHERYPLESPPPTDALNASHPLCKRNRSYRLSFIENAHTVTTKKLTATSTSSNATILRFVQPRRRIGSHNSSRMKRQHSSNIEHSHRRSRSSNRFSCAQQ